MNHIWDALMDGQNAFLVCHCRPLMCHGDVIKSVLEDRLIRRWERDEQLLAMDADERAQEMNSVIVDYKN